MFEGFSPQTSDFLWSLALNNNRTWFLEHKEEFEAVLNRPFRALAAATHALMEARWPEQDFQLHIARIYRDARRAYGRGPYKDRLWFTIQRGERHAVGPMFWFELDGTSWSYGMGFWEDSAEQAEMFRRQIDADPARFERLIDGIAARGEFQLWGEAYKRPKGDRGEKLNPWYNRKHASVGYERAFGGELYGASLPELLADAYAGLMPMYRFYLEAYDALLESRAAQRGLALTEG